MMAWTLPPLARAMILAIPAFACRDSASRSSIDSGLPDADAVPIDSGLRDADALSIDSSLPDANALPIDSGLPDGGDGGADAADGNAPLAEDSDINPIDDGTSPDDGGADGCPSTQPVGVCSTTGLSCGPYPGAAPAGPYAVFGCGVCTCAEGMWRCDADGGAGAADASSQDALTDAEADGAPSGTYTCHVVQIRHGNCQEPWPPGFSLDIDGGVANGGLCVTFALTISGSTITVPGWFSCTGSWNGSVFTCTITGAAPSGAACPGVTWAVSTSGYQGNDSLPLQPGQLWAGIATGNGFNSLCQR